MIPSGSGDVTLQIPARSCQERGAVCIGRRPLTRPEEVTVGGPEMNATVTRAAQAHDGTTTFTLDFEFSHEPAGLSYRTVRDDLFDVEEGLIKKARRLTQGENRRWELTIQPSKSADVTIDARPTTDCKAEYAICDADGRMFNGNLEHTVPGPRRTDLPMISIAAGETPVIEGSDVVMTLSRTGSTDAALTVGITIDENGEVLADNPPSTVVFAAGASQATLRIPTVDDDVDEPDTTVRVTVARGQSYEPDPNATSASVVVESDDVGPMTARWASRWDEPIWKLSSA